MIEETGFKIIEGEEGKYDKLVKLIDDFVVEIVYFPRKRVAKADIDAIKEIHQRVFSEATNRVIPPSMPLVNKKAIDERPQTELPSMIIDKLEEETVSFYVTSVMMKSVLD